MVSSVLCALACGRAVDINDAMNEAVQCLSEQSGENTY
jgi:hypothetical protein